MHSAFESSGSDFGSSLSTVTIHAEGCATPVVLPIANTLGDITVPLAASDAARADSAAAASVPLLVRVEFSVPSPVPLLFANPGAVEAALATTSLKKLFETGSASAAAASNTADTRVLSVMGLPQLEYKAVINTGRRGCVLLAVVTGAAWRDLPIGTPVAVKLMPVDARILAELDVALAVMGVGGPAVDTAALMHVFTWCLCRDWVAIVSQFCGEVSASGVHE